MWSEWAEGKDIGQLEVLTGIAETLGIDAATVEAALNAPENDRRLEDNWAHAQSLGVIGVPSFVIGEEIFWGNDRFDFVLEHLRELQS